MKSIKLLVIILFLLFTFSSCRDQDEGTIVGSLININLPEYDNIPVIANVENSFVLTLNAKNFNYNYDDYVDFTKDSLVITITANKSNSANSNFIVFNNLNEVIFSEELNTDKVIVKDNLGGKIPSRVKVKLENYTEILNIVVAVKN